VIKIWTNLIKFGQNQHLASQKSFDTLRLCPGVNRDALMPLDLWSTSKQGDFIDL